MIAAELLKLLCCPDNHQPLAVADSRLIDSLNARIASHDLRNRAGQAVTDKIEGGLVREDQQYLYPIRGGIPVLLVDEALPLN